MKLKPPDQLAYKTQKCYVVYSPSDNVIWEGYTFLSRQDAINGVNEFWDSSSAWTRLEKAGWKIKRASLSIKL